MIARNIEIERIDCCLVLLDERWIGQRAAEKILAREYKLEALDRMRDHFPSVFLPERGTIHTTPIYDS